MKIFICPVCGFIGFDEAPERCPVCGTPKEKFKQNDNIFKESREKSPEAEVKHIPALRVEQECGLIPEDDCTDVLIRIGEKLHPMEAKHFIMYIDCYVDRKYVERIHLTPNGINPAGCVHLKAGHGKLFTAVINCNIHGYWYKDVEL